jgi:hypothetical protein
VATGNGKAAAAVSAVAALPMMTVALGDVYHGLAALSLPLSRKWVKPGHEIDALVASLVPPIAAEIVAAAGLSAQCQLQTHAPQQSTQSPHRRLARLMAAL